MDVRSIGVPYTLTGKLTITTRTTTRRFEIVLLVSLAVLTAVLAGTLMNATLAMQIVA